ncbi:fatty acid desaturase [Aporhodopirellula aestuarii]|uniref:Fatty acid desaturase n=1 Tax=Aporhodopirellula aestuarii TaxID=2950107 RepID=A0ABT0U5P4_9BACT|nr:fatty acid desaturase [Aporhodopirellula aestuarii]MCM2372122.1 fatty acid desaturase [Aporhodopirellula aestuarii]
MKTTSFDDRQCVSRETLKRLQERTDVPAYVRLTVQFSLIAALLSVLLFARFENTWFFVFTAVILGLVQATLFAPLHECTHLTAFRSRKANQAVAWLSGFALLWTPASYREFHFEHHRHTHDPNRDPEIALGGESFANWPVRMHEYFALASGLLLLVMRLLMILVPAAGVPDSVWSKLAPHVRPRARRKIVWESRLVLLLYVGSAVLAVNWMPRLGYLLVSLFVAHSFLALYLASEHTGCEMTGNILNRTRTVISNRLMRFFMWNLPYHSEHHAYPSIPFYCLPQLHEALHDDLVYVDPGYCKLHGRVIGKIFRKQDSSELARHQQAERINPNDQPRDRTDTESSASNPTI